MLKACVVEKVLHDNSVTRPQRYWVLKKRAGGNTCLTVKQLLPGIHVCLN